MKAARGFGTELTIAGFVILALPLIIEGLWIVEFNRHDNQQDRVAAYMAHFPAFAREITYLENSSILLSLIGAAVLAVAAIFSQGAVRILAILFVLPAVGLGVLLSLLHLWQAL